VHKLCRDQRIHITNTYLHDKFLFFREIHHVHCTFLQSKKIHKHLDVVFKDQLNEKEYVFLTWVSNNRCAACFLYTLATMCFFVTMGISPIRIDPCFTSTPIYHAWNSGFIKTICPLLSSKESPMWWTKCFNLFLFLYNNRNVHWICIKHFA